MADDAIEFHRAEQAQERGEGICRTCLLPIWNEGGTVGHQRRDEGWSDRIERGGDSLVCFSAVEYRHVPLAGREACIYDRAYKRAAAEDRQRITAALEAAKPHIPPSTDPKRWESIIVRSTLNGALRVVAAGRPVADGVD